MQITPEDVKMLDEIATYHIGLGHEWQDKLRSLANRIEAALRAPDTAAAIERHEAIMDKFDPVFRALAAPTTPPSDVAEKLRKYELLRRAINEDMPDDTACTPKCDSYGHDEDCLNGDAAETIVRLKAKLAAAPTERSVTPITDEDVNRALVVFNGFDAEYRLTHRHNVLRRVLEDYASRQAVGKLQHDPAHTCAVCQQAWIDSESGFDTCASCVGRV